ncbi:ABC transporter permease [Halorussus sp. AFM4]|uniref:ABC transporter permease n=1 Tax=Halorussus sp. AFM4 TaxID=3421651 RepID=UPI003EC02020
MSLRSLLRKEALRARHNLGALFVLLVVLPAAIGVTTVVFQEVIPRDAPVAVVPENETVTDDELAVVRGGVTLFAEPVAYDTREAAMTALRRESVYAVIQVPPGIMDEGRADVTFVLYVDEAIVPYEEPSRMVAALLDSRLDRALPAQVSVERTTVGSDHTLSEYLLPVGMMVLVLLVAFVYLPTALVREARVLDRLRVESSLRAVLATKLLFVAAVLAVPLAVFAGVAGALGYAVDPLAPAAVGVYLLTFVYAASLSSAITLLTKFRDAGRFVNVGAFFGALAVSNLAYPAGFFSPVRRELARHSPLHHSMIIARSLLMKDVDLALFADWLAALAGFAALSVGVLAASAALYERWE